jgi:hypothetical protein
MQIELEKIFVDILKRELELPNNYGVDNKGNEIPTVFIGFQNVLLGKTDKLQISVTVTDIKPLSTKSVFVNSTSGEVEQSEVTQRENVQIDIFSVNSDARLRRWEILSALSSFYSQEMQNKYFFKIANLPSTFLNTSDAEGGSQLNRYSISFSCFTHYTKTKTSTFYDTFQGVIYIEEPYKEIEFEI